MHFTCQAHQSIVSIWSEGLDELEDPLPTDCAKWLAKLTDPSLAYQVLDGDHAFGPGEGISDDGAVENAEVLRRVEVSNVRDSYCICRKGNTLCVVFVQYDPTGHAVLSRIDFAPV